MATTTSRALHQFFAVGSLPTERARQQAGAVNPTNSCLSSARLHRWLSPSERLGTLLVARRGEQAQTWGTRVRVANCCRCSAASDDAATPSSSGRSPHRQPAGSDPLPDVSRTERKKEAHRHAPHWERLGPRKRAKIQAGPAGSRAWKRAHRKAAKVAESISEVMDAAAAAVALPTLAPLSREAVQAFAVVSGQGPCGQEVTASQNEHRHESTASALVAFLELDGARLPCPESGAFFTSPQQFTASHALRLEDMGPRAQGAASRSEDANGTDAWGEAARMALPVLGLAAATVAGALFTRQVAVTRLLPRLAMRALAYPALFLQTGIMASEQGAERARQAALWSLPPALLVSSCFMGWRVAAASAAAFLTAQLVNVNVSERLPRASHWWQVVLVAAVVASAVDALVFFRISSGAARGLSLAFALTGDFDGVGRRQRLWSGRPAVER